VCLLVREQSLPNQPSDTHARATEAKALSEMSVTLIASQRQRFYVHVCVSNLMRAVVGMRRVKEQLEADFAQMAREHGGRYPRMDKYRPLSRDEAIQAKLVPQPAMTWYRVDGTAVRSKVS
jgi:hypothetical protein